MTPVTIVVLTDNHARFVAPAIDLALARTDERVEVIVVNNGSTDDPCRRGWMPGAGARRLPDACAGFAR